MVRKIAIACLSMVLGGSLNASDDFTSKAFIGLEGGYSEVQGESLVLSNGTYFQNTGEDGIYGIRIGAQNDEWRTTLLFDYYDNTETDQNVEQLLLTVDYLFLNGQYVSGVTLDPYIGANVGYANYESSFVESDGIVYGGQAGLIVGATENVNLDFSYRYSLSEAEELDHLGSFIFAVDYIY